MNLYLPVFTKITSRAYVWIAIIIASLSSAFAVVYDNANFSGEWTLNEQKSELGEFGARLAPRKLKIQQSADGVTIERTSTFNGEDRTSNEKLTFDGKEAENTVFGNSKKKSTTKWNDDGQTMNINSTIFFERDGQTTEIKVTENWKLINNGQSLSLESTSTSARGTNTVKAVYDKAK